MHFVLASSSFSLSLSCISYSEGFAVSSLGRIWKVSQTLLKGMQNGTYPALIHLPYSLNASIYNGNQPEMS